MLGELIGNPLFTNIVGPAGFIVLGFILRYIYREVKEAIDSMQNAVIKKVDTVDTKVESVINEQARVRTELSLLGTSHQALKERTAKLEGKEEARQEYVQAKVVEALAKENHP